MFVLCLKSRRSERIDIKMFFVIWFVKANDRTNDSLSNWAYIIVDYIVVYDTPAYILILN